MSGVFSGFSDSFTGNGGAPGSILPKAAIPQLTSGMLNNLEQARMVTNIANSREESQWQAQQNLLPFIYKQLGYNAGYGSDGAITGFGYQGTEAQNSMDQLARQGFWSQPAQYNNIGYDYAEEPGGGVNISERGDSQRQQFLNSQEHLIQESQGLRNTAWDNLTSAQGRGDQTYNAALEQLYGSMGTQQEALDATRRQLQTAEGSQVGALQQLGFQRDASGNIVKNDGSPLSAYERMLMQQATTAQSTQRSALGNLGYNTDASGNTSFDPNSSVAQMFAQLDRIRGDAAGQTGTAQDIQGASLQRMGMMQDAQGRWVNDPGGNEAAMRSLQGDYLKRASAAMQGNAPVDPGIERSLAQEKQLLEETMIRQLGPGWRTTSPGQEALRNLEQRANETRYRVQQDALGQGTTQAMGLQGVNLQTLASMASSNDPVLRAMANELLATQTAGDFRNQNASTAQGISAQGANTVGQMAGTQSNINSQTLASLYGLTAPALAAAGQMGNQANANTQTNQAGFANVNNMGTANMDALMRMYGLMSNLGQQTQQAVGGKAQGALSFQNSNAAALGTIPASIQQLYGNANQGRMQSLAALYPALQSGYDQSQKLDIAQLYGNLGGVNGQLSTNQAGQIMQGDQTRYATNINNIFWQNLMKSGGQFVGGGMGMSPMGGGG